MHTPPDIDPGYQFDEESLSKIYEFLRSQDMESGSTHDYKEVIDYLASKAKGASITAIGITFNSIIRQTLANLKASADQGMSFAQIFERYKEDPFSISSGWKIRMAANFLSIFPAAELGKVMGESGSGAIAQAFVAALVETAIGIFPEIKAGQPTREKLGGIDLNAKTFSMIRAAAPFYLARNFSMWMATHIELEDGKDSRNKAMLYRSISGIFAGAVSAIPDSMANRSLMEIAISSDSLSPLEAIKKTLSEDPKIFLMRSLRGAYLRGIGGGFSAILFSKEGREVLEDALDGIITMVTEFLSDENRSAVFLSHLIKQMQDGSDELPIDYRDYLTPTVFSADYPLIHEDLSEKSSNSISGSKKGLDKENHQSPVIFTAFRSLPPAISSATPAAPYPPRAKGHLDLSEKLEPHSERPANTFFLRILENFNKAMSPDGCGKGGTGLQ